jgi:nicotinate-nucleotide adenylyltransferase
MKIGLFGGTFNPVHIGHLRAAVEVGEGLGLDRVFLIPAAQPPHKGRETVAAAADRLRMLDLAVEDQTGLTVSDVEISRSGPSYTIDTVRHFRQTLPQGSAIFLVMGADAFLEIDTWKSFRELLCLVPVVVISRPGPAAAEGGRQRAAVESFLRARLAADLSVSADACRFEAAGMEPITWFAVTAMDVSSSRVRELIRAGRSVHYLVPAKVADFINRKGLYR